MSALSRARRSAVCFLLVFSFSLYLFSSPPRILLITLVSSLIHEAAHILTAKLFGREIHAFRFSFTAYRPDLGSGGAFSCAAICFAGPLSNVALIFISFLTLGKSSSVAGEIAGINLCLALFNLCVLPGSDGEGIARAFLCSVIKKRAAEAVVNILCLFFSFSFFLLFSYRFFITGTGFFPFFCSFAFLLSSTSRFLQE